MTTRFFYKRWYEGMTYLHTKYMFLVNEFEYMHDWRRFIMCLTFLSAMYTPAEGT